MPGASLCQNNPENTTNRLSIYTYTDPTSICGKHAVSRTRYGTWIEKSKKVNSRL